MAFRVAPSPLKLFGCPKILLRKFCEAPNLIPRGTPNSCPFIGTRSVRFSQRPLADLPLVTL